MFYFYFRGHVLVEPIYIHLSDRRRIKTKVELGQNDGATGFPTLLIAIFSLNINCVRLLNKIIYPHNHNIYMRIIELLPKNLIVKENF